MAKASIEYWAGWYPTFIMSIPTGFNTWVDNRIAFQLGLGFLESSKSFHMRMIIFLLKSSMAAPCGAFITNWNTPICRVLHSKLVTTKKPIHIETRHIKPFTCPSCLHQRYRIDWWTIRDERKNIWMGKMPMW